MVIQVLFDSCEIVCHLYIMEQWLPLTYGKDITTIMDSIYGFLSGCAASTQVGKARENCWDRHARGGDQA